MLHVQAGQDSRRNGLTDLPLDIGLVLAPAIERDSKHFLELAECELDNDVAVSRIIP